MIGLAIPSASTVKYHPIAAKDQSRLLQFGRKVFPGVFLGYALYAGETLERRHVGRRHGAAGHVGRVGKPCSEAQCKRSNAEEWWKTSHSQSQLVQKKLSGRDHGIRRSTSARDQHVRSEELSGVLQGSSDKSRPTDEITHDGEVPSDFWSIEGNYIHRHHVEPRVELHVPKEETFPIPLKCMDVTRTAHTTLDGLQESRIDDCWNNDANQNLSESWTGFTKFTTLIARPPKRICAVGRRLTTKQATSRLVIICGPKFGLICQKQLNERNSSNGLSRHRSSTMRES